MAPKIFSVPVFLVVFRETLETAIIVSVLLAFLKQTLDGPNRDRNVYKALCKQVWLGAAIGFTICLAIASAIIAVFYTVGRDVWAAHEYYYEGVFCILASVIITVMGFSLLRVGRLKEKWRVKLAKALEDPVKTDSKWDWVKRWLEKHALFLLPFITVLREGVEAIVFISGVSFSTAPSEVPLSVAVGLGLGAIVGYAIYRGGALASIHVFLVISTCFLYLIAAGLFSRGVWFFEAQQWNEVVGGDAAELGDGPGSYDIDRSVWHVNCCSPQLDGGGGWGVLNGIFGWNNSATYGSVISYNVYWIVVASGFVLLKFYENNGRLPFAKVKDNGKKVQSRESEPLLRAGRPESDQVGASDTGTTSATSI